jgi:predicted PurR-regulated permease PerM
MQSDFLQRHRSLRIVIGLVIVVLAMHVVSVIWSTLVLFGDIILLFFLAWIISFLLEPVSILLQKRGLPRTFAVALIYLALLVVVSGAIVLAIPSIQDESKLLATEITSALSTTNLAALSTNAIGTLRHFGLSEQNARSIVDSFSSQVPGWTTSLTNNAVDTTTQLFTSLLTVLFNAFLVIILSFYMMLDGDRLIERWVVKLPPSWIPDVRLFQRYVEQIFGGFFRAQLAIGAIYGLLTWLVLLLLGQANGLLVALMAGIIMLLPFIGPFLAIVPPVLLVLLQSPSSRLGFNLIVLVVALVVAQQIVMQLIAPRIFGTQMGIHPLLLFAALLLGAKEGGIWGAFFAGPVVAVTYAMMRVYYERFTRTSPLFKAQAAIEEVGGDTLPEEVLPESMGRGEATGGARTTEPDDLLSVPRKRT